MKYSDVVFCVFAVMIAICCPGVATAHHVSIGRWVIEGCSFGKEFEIFKDNNNFAIQIAYENGKKELRPLKILKNREGNLYEFWDINKSKNNSITYVIDKRKYLVISSDDAIRCSGSPSRSKGGSALNH